MAENKKISDGSEERKLSKAEKRRLENFHRIARELEAQGYATKELTASTLKANTLGVLFGVLLAAVFVVLYFVLKRPVSEVPTEKRFVIAIVFVAEIVIHELIHGITWSCGLKGGFRENIEFGIIWQALTPYCTCKSVIGRGCYFLGSIMPCIILGILPSILAIVIGNVPLLVLGALNVMAAGGDLMVILMILKNSAKGKEQLFLDHPSKIGLIVFERDGE